MHCDKCGKEILEDGMFCVYCGNVIKNSKHTESKNIVTTKDKIIFLMISIFWLGMAIYLLIRQGVLKI